MNTIRLEFHSNAANSHKWYEISEIGRKTGKCLVRWGRCGWAAMKVGGASQDIVNGEQILDYFAAMKKLSEKERKGYEKV